MEFINIILQFFEQYEQENAETLTPEERLAVENFAQWLDENTESECFM